MKNMTKNINNNNHSSYKAGKGDSLKEEPLKLKGREALMEENSKPLYNINSVCRLIEKQLGENLIQGKHYVDYIFFNGTQLVQKIAAVNVQKKMEGFGYYCKVSWKETSPGGSIKWFVRVSVDPLKKEGFLKRLFRKRY